MSRLPLGAAKGGKAVLGVQFRTGTAPAWEQLRALAAIHHLQQQASVDLQKFAGRLRGDAVDLRVDHVARDLDRDRLLGVGNVGEFCLHGFVIQDS